MPKSQSKLPSLDLLPAFDAAARHLSFTKAADELALTQSAVSHQIRALEDHLGACVSEAVRTGGDEGTASVHEAAEAISRLVRS